jgi:large subunit GTPase 1
VRCPAGAVGLGGKKPKPQRAEHKFHKKAARTKGDRGQQKEGTGAAYDGASLPMGKRGGIVRVAGY